MSTGAKVHSLDALVTFREALCTFTADVREALTAADTDIRRTFDWINAELQWWQKEIYRRQDLVGQARNALNHKKLERIFGRKPDLTEEEKALRKAIARLQDAEEMVVRLKKAVPQLQHAVTTYEGPARQLAGYIDAVVPNDLALLNRKIDALDDYVRLAPPTARAPVAAGMTSVGPSEETHREPEHQPGPDAGRAEDHAAEVGRNQPAVE
jgi:DNA repair exonuclease SbcCD ATPase subunit